MKYILKKDLPFAKAGSIVYNFEGELFDNDINYDCFVDKPADIIYPNCYLYSHNRMIFIGDKRDLVEQGWIEKAKPREYFVELYGKDFQLSRIVDVKNAPNDDQYYKYIKVREVL